MATIQNNAMYGVTIQCKYKNAAQWLASEVLAAGEIGIELDTGKGKVGDGVKTWSELNYSVDPTVNGLISALTERVTTNEGSITTMSGDISALQSKDTEHDTAIGNLQSADTTHETRMSTIESKDTEQDGRLDALEGITVISANPAPQAQA